MTRPKLPSGLERTLKLWPTSRPIALLIRHAEREEIPAGKFGRNCPITENGVLSSRELGERFLRGRLDSIHVSPLPRCQQTAEAIIEGTDYQPGEGMVIEHSNLLGEPGPFVVDGKEAGKHFLQQGTKNVLAQMLEGKKLPGIRNLAEGSELLLNHILDNTLGNDGCHLFVSHDAIIIPFIHELMEGGYRLSKWLAPLDGCMLYIDNDGVHMISNGKRFTVREAR